MLTESQREALALFRDISQIEDEQLSLDIMLNYDFNVDNAVNGFMLGGSGGVDNAAPVAHDHSSSVGITNRGVGDGSNRGSTNFGSSSSSSSSSSSGGRRRSRSSEGEVESTVHAPVVGAPNGAAQGAVNQANAGGLMNFVLNPFKWLFQERIMTINPDQETMLFVNDFNRQYSAQHPRFHGRSYTDAVRQAFRNSKFLVVYLHSPMHEDTSKFCQQVLCNPEIAEHCDRTALTWAGQVWDSEAYFLSQQLRVSTYPFMAILMPKSETVVEIADRVQGKIGASSLLARLRNVMRTFEGHLNQVRQAEQRRRADSLLREEQDREFRESEAQDRRNRELREQEEREERQRAEQEARAQREAAQAEEAAATAKASSIESKKAAMPTEPMASADVATVRFQLPTNAKVTRRFKRDALVKDMHDWLEVYFYENKSDTKRFSVSTAHPKVELTDMGATVDSVGLFPRGMLYVQDLDL